MSDAPVTRPDLDALIARLHREAHADMEWLRLAADALAAERARADQSNAALLDDAADAIEARYYEQDAAVEYLRSRSRGLTAEQR